MTEVTLIPGDGIGPEITEATIRVIDKLDTGIQWVRHLAGTTALEEVKNPLPEETLASIAKTKYALKGPLATPIGSGFRSCNVALRKHFDMFANVRPAKTIPGVPCRFDNVDLVLIRENTEGMYSGIEHYVDSKKSAAEAIAVTTRSSSERIVRFAFEYAKKNGRKKVTLVHKANILKLTNGLFLDCGRAISQEYPELEFNDLIVDATAMKMVTQPEQFDVVVTTNLFGDILSDLSAGLIGGLGVAPAANIGAEDLAMFEAVHGTAPDIAGKGIANPSALMLSAVLMLEHLGRTDAAKRMKNGIQTALATDDTRTRDLGGNANTQQFTDGVIGALK